MNRRGLRRAAALCALSTTLSLALGHVQLPSVFALFDGRTTNAGSEFAAGWVSAPTGLATPSVSGYDVTLGWTPGSSGVTGQTLYGSDRSSTSNCTGATYSQLATMASASTATYTDTGRANGSLDGHWFCYRMTSTHATWSKSADFAAVRIGLATTAVALGTGGGTINRNDTITLTFNQQTNIPATNVTVDVCTTGIVLIGGSCATPTSYSIGKLTVSGATIGTGQTFTASTVALSGTSPQTVTVTLTANLTATIAGTPTWTFTPASTIQSSAGAAAVCTSTCTQPTVSGGF